ncbi:kelch repeat-containing protein [Corallococcus exercitus]|uniref:kelch repeat-containing protein n=1 Tax=Corallococcus exercitus TaxID=2316736 RepID=UPI0034634F60
MKKASLPLMMLLTAALLAGCSESSSDTGSARFAVSVRQAVTSSIARVSVTSGGPDIRSVTVDLAPTDGVWGGTIGNLPAGAHRAFFARAYDASGTVLFQGSASGITISENQTALVALTLQQVNPPPPFENEAPLIDSLVASSTSVPAGGSITLLASAHDPNPGDTLSYSWSATAGVFSSPSSASTSWTAPASTGLQSLTLVVTDDRGLASSIVLAVNVQPGGEGEAQLSISFNSSPSVALLSASPTQLVVGQPTSVSVEAADPDGDSLSYAWSASCAGTWTDATSSAARFTPSLLPAAACNNCRLTVAVSDGRGGRGSGSVALCVRNAPPVNHLNPVILRSYRSSDTAGPGQVITYEVVASDPEGSALSFSWDANTGALGTPTHGASRSRVTWTAPSCLSTGTTPTITATVTNAFNLTATRSFVVTGLPTCPAMGWTSTGSMTSSRYAFTATLLPNGKVLAAGGYNDDTSEFVATAELYDPATGTWSQTGSMATRRAGHTSTLLPDGRVLVAGGSRGTALATAEVYDPASGSWSGTGSMMGARDSHTATRLPDGRVLVTGGYRVGPLATAELYDPTTGTWSQTAPMSMLRALHTATLLSNGKVLVTGGDDDGVVPTTSELYDPATGTWSAPRSTGAAFTNHTATLLPNGKVLVVGATTAELYEPATDTWSEIDATPAGRTSHTATLLLDGKVLIAGGFQVINGVLIHSASAEVYDPGPGTWSPADSMISAREAHVAILLFDGRVLVAGGSSDSRVHGAAELYGPAGPWRRTGSTSVSRSGAPGTLLPSGKVIVAGGYSIEGFEILATAELYDPATGIWTPAGTMASRREYHTATVLHDGKLLVAGGLGGDLLAEAEVYDPASGTWSVTGPLGEVRWLHTATLLPDGKVLVTGGSGDTGTLASSEVYDPVSGTWSTTGSMTTRRMGHTATLLPDGKVLVTGGTAASGPDLATAELYDPATGTWSTTGSMSTAFASHTATLLQDGRVLIVGGLAAELYDPASGTWSATGTPATARVGHTATLLSDGKVLVAGGIYIEGIPYRTSELYDPATGTWSDGGSMAGVRYNHTATLLPDGRVLVTGGFGDGPLATAELYVPR